MIVARLRRLQSDQFLTGVMKLLAGASAARLIAVAFTPLLTRLYTPADFGVMSLFASLSAFLVPVATLRYEAAIPIARSDQDAALLIRIIFLSGLVVSTIAALVALSVVWNEWQLPLIAELGGTLSLLPIAILLGASYECFQFASFRHKQFSKLARTQVSQTALGVALKLIVGLSVPGPAGLVWGQMIQQGGAGARLAWRSLQETLSAVPTSWGHLRTLAKEFADFPATRLPAQLLQVLAAKVPIFAIATMYSIEVAGQFGLAFSMMALPMTLLAQTAANAFHGQIAAHSLNDISRIRQESWKLTRYTLAVGVVPSLGLFVYAEEIFAFVFGRQWAVAGDFVEKMAIYLLLQMVASPLMQVLSVLRKGKAFLNLAVGRLSLAAVAFFLAFHFRLDATTAVTLFSVAMSIYYMSVLVYIARTIDRECR